jgi:hypothetical protein
MFAPRLVLARALQVDDVGHVTILNFSMPRLHAMR